MARWDLRVLGWSRSMLRWIDESFVQMPLLFIRRARSLAVLGGRPRSSARTSALAVLCAASLVLGARSQAETDDLRLVERIVDGDTIVLDGGEKVRLIGVDTPETVHPQKPVEYFGKEASAFTKRLAEGKRVRLEGDPVGQSRDRRGRTLAYVWLADGELLNLEIIRQGYGHALTKYPFSRMEEFRAAQREAQEEGRGLWADVEVEDDDEHDEDLEPSTPPSATPASSGCIPVEQCCKICSTGKACGNSCISRAYTCHKGRGCSCNAEEVCR